MCGRNRTILYWPTMAGSGEDGRKAWQTTGQLPVPLGGRETEREAGTGLQVGSAGALLLGNHGRSLERAMVPVACSLNFSRGTKCGRGVWVGMYPE